MTAYVKAAQQMVAGTYLRGRFAVSGAADLVIDPSLGDVCDTTLSGNRGLSIGAGTVDGQKLLLRVLQDATGSRTLTPDTTIRVGVSPVAWVLTTTAAKLDRLGFEWSATAAKWDFIAIAQGH